MARFVLRYIGPGSKPAADVQSLHDRPDVDVVDDSAPRMLLIDAPDAAGQELAEGMANWVVHPETTIELPRPHPGAPTLRTEPD